jgi:hypothetical protein
MAAHAVALGFQTTCLVPSATNAKAVLAMKIWVADELGQIKSCSFENGGVDGKPFLSDAEVTPSPDKHDRRDYVQIMTAVKWQVLGKSMVRCPLLSFRIWLTSGFSLLLLLLDEEDRCKYWTPQLENRCGITLTTAWNHTICL